MHPETAVSGLEFPGSGPLVVKVGGSVTRNTAAFHSVMSCLKTARRPFVLVTGGGAFADQVRAAQPEIGFNDETAHRMALFALNQTAWMAASFVNDMEPLERIETLEARLADGKRCVWLPFAECHRDPELPATWEATSDAAAARLAQRLGGLPVVFVKSRMPTTGDRSPASLVADGLIDSVSGAILKNAGIAFAVVTPNEPDRLQELLGTRRAEPVLRMADGSKPMERHRSSAHLDQPEGS